MTAPWSIADSGGAFTAGGTGLTPTFIGNSPSPVYGHTILVNLTINLVSGGAKPAVTPDANGTGWLLVHEEYVASQLLYQQWVTPCWDTVNATGVHFSWSSSHPAAMSAFRIVGAKAKVQAQGATVVKPAHGHLSNTVDVAATSSTTLADSLYTCALFTAGSDGTSGHHLGLFGYPSTITSQLDIANADPASPSYQVDTHTVSANTGFAFVYSIFDVHASPAKTAPDTPDMHSAWTSLALTSDGPYCGTGITALEVGVNTPPVPCDQGGPIQSFLYWNGSEVANGARTLAYMASDAAGDCQPKFEVSPGCPCWIEKVEALGDPDAVFRGPALDPAPWYDASIPASGDFLGLLIDNDSERQLFDGLSFRTITPRLGGLTGAQVGPDRKQPREWKVQGWLISATCAGAEYGRRWLQAQLQATGCEACLLGELRVRSACPPCDGSDNSEGEWYVYDVGLTDGPKYTGPVDPACCCVEGVAFTLTAGNPYLYKAPVVCVSAQPVVPTSTTCVDFDTWFCSVPDPICCDVAPPSIGTLASIVTISAGTGVANVTVGTYASCPPGTSSAITSLTVPSLSAGTTLVIDSARRQITYTAADGTESDGTPYIQLPDGQGIPWVEVSSCDAAQCICVGVAAYCGTDGSATVTIETQSREA